MANLLDSCPSEFRGALALLDAGDAAGLAEYLRAHPGVVNATRIRCRCIRRCVTGTGGAAGCGGYAARVGGALWAGGIAAFLRALG